MGFETVVDLDCDRTTAIGGVDKKTKKNNPTKIEGYYIGTREVPSPKSKTGLANLHVLKTKEGNVGVWGKTNLDQKMRAVTPGQLIRVTFVGMQETKNNPMYKYKVEVDAENTIDVSGVSPEEGDSDDTGTTDGGEGEESFGDDPQDEELEAGAEEAAQDETAPARAQRPAAPAQTPSAERQAKVKALLGGGNRSTRAS